MKIHVHIRFFAQKFIIWVLFFWNSRDAYVIKLSVKHLFSIFFMIIDYSNNIARPPTNYKCVKSIVMLNRNGNQKCYTPRFIHTKLKFNKYKNWVKLSGMNGMEISSIEISIFPSRPAMRYICPIGNFVHKRVKRAISHMTRFSVTCVGINSMKLSWVDKKRN